MRVITLRLKNWMNFKALAAADLHERMFVIGPNASGKSNLLDALRFLRDVARPAGPRPAGGGLQKAVADRGGLSKLRCLNAKRDTEVRIEIGVQADDITWLYTLGFKGEGRANNRIVISHESVTKNGTLLFCRPDDLDAKDPERLVQTHLEYIGANADFRDLVHFLSEITYLHLVPQLLKFGEQIGGNLIEQDPFGQALLHRIAATNERTRNARLRRISSALKGVVPQFSELRFQKDAITGAPHLEANFRHWRPTGAWQRENQFSDGTLRLIGLLWALVDGQSLLLLEEPELSLNEAIVRRLPALIDKVQQQSKHARQVIVTTHSEALLSDRSIAAEEVIRLQPTEEGTEVRAVEAAEATMLESGLSVGEVLLPATRPEGLGQLELGLP
jgi:predicted ATPase